MLRRAIPWTIATDQISPMANKDRSQCKKTFILILKDDYAPAVVVHEIVCFVRLYFYCDISLVCLRLDSWKDLLVTLLPANVWYPFLISAPFDVVGGIWNLYVSVPDNCLFTCTF